MGHATGHNLTLDFSRMFRKSGQGPVETLSNIAVFVPFGFFLGEWLASSNRTGSWRRVISKHTLYFFRKGEWTSAWLVGAEVSIEPIGAIRRFSLIFCADVISVFVFLLICSIFVKWKH